MRKKVQDVLDQVVKPAIQRDGGDIQLIDVNEDGVVTVQLQGACHGCPGAQMTLKMGVERALKERIPEVTKVVAV